MIFVQDNMNSNGAPFLVTLRTMNEDVLVLLWEDEGEVLVLLILLLLLHLLLLNRED